MDLTNSCAVVIGLIADFVLATSSGNSICTAPAFSSIDILNALLTISGILSAFRIDHLHFVIGLNMVITSIFWWDSLCKRFVFVCPVIANTGDLSMFAFATPV